MKKLIVYVMACVAMLIGRADGAVNVKFDGTMYGWWAEDGESEIWGYYGDYGADPKSADWADDFVDVKGSKEPGTCPGEGYAFPVTITPGTTFTPQIVDASTDAKFATVSMKTDAEMRMMMRNSTDEEDGAEWWFNQVWPNGQTDSSRAWVVVLVTDVPKGNLCYTFDLTTKLIADGSKSMKAYAQQYGATLPDTLEIPKSISFKVGIKETGEVFPERLWALYNPANNTQYRAAVNKVDSSGGDSEMFHTPGLWLVTQEMIDEQRGGAQGLVVTFDANGGTASVASKKVESGATVGELPTATREGYVFLGWFTAAVGGMQVMAATVVTEDVTYYAHWDEIVDDPDVISYWWPEYHSGKWVYCEADGGVVIVDVLSPGTTVEFPASIDGKTVVGICTSWGDFTEDYNVSKIIIPATVRYIEEGAFAFSGSEHAGIQQIEVKDGNPRYSSANGILYDRISKIVHLGATSITVAQIPADAKRIGACAFAFCKKLTSVNWPTTLRSVGDEAFTATSLTSADLSRTSVRRVSQQAFAGCAKLATAKFPATLETLGGYLFWTYGSQSALKSVYFYGDCPSIVMESDDGHDDTGWYEEDDPTWWGKIYVRDKNGDDYTDSYLTGVTTYVAEETSGWGAVPGTWQGNPIRYFNLMPLGKCNVVAGEKVTLETGLIGYRATGLPSGLKYDAKTGKITGAAKTATATDGAVVRFTKSGEDDAEMTIVVRAEEISVGCAGLSSGPLPAGVVGTAGGMDIQIDSEGGTKSVSVAKFPAGMKYDSKSGKITGAPTKPGEYEVVLTVTTMYGNKEVVKIPVSVAAMPVMAVGKFDGFVSVGGKDFGTFTLTTTDAGKLTAKVITAAGTVSFSGTCWDSVEDGVYRAALTTKKGETLTLTLDSNAAWDVDQLSGEFAAADGRRLSVSAQRNAFGKTWYFNATGDEAAGWTLAYTEDTKGAALTVTLKADGSTSIAGKLPNGTDTKGKAVTLKVSASGYANVGGLREGAVIADFAPILTINKVKKALAIKANLWFDRKNDHPEGVGEARTVE